MAASEVAMAASEVAKVVAQAPTVNWWVVGASSAVIGAAVNALTSVVTQHLAWRRERIKQAELRAPAQLETALVLEAFARHAVAQLDAVAERIVEYLAEQQGETAPPRTAWTELAFDASLLGDRAMLPINILSHCLELPTVLAESRAWIDAVATEEWPDALDLNQLEAQRAILYGLVAGELANEIRTQIKAPASTLSRDCLDRLQREFGKIKQHCVDTTGTVELIPDLKARLMRELPEALHDPRWLTTTSRG
ncbi:hypothetical protein [Burkholderia sp. AU6039]|uniref:hypothetical protein n=1 Tax=Burkholderia sp. AU6039 TaxID=2015344 RepID=UPI000B7A1348|nr:hypothetical protein [Burkholderia sp. AU6039]OXJ06909.1 hypothetical protein CFB39_38185 [Burkholderia sp. AU6039]